MQVGTMRGERQECWSPLEGMDQEQEAGEVRPDDKLMEQEQKWQVMWGSPLRHNH